ncbi:MAG: hypothetical protein M0Q22_10190 [Sulfuritalea sp.]|nr:hypothetical protein [Sulfuritalea sp.]
MNVSVTPLAQVLERSDIRRVDAFAIASAPTLASGFPRLDAELPDATDLRQRTRVAA